MANEVENFRAAQDTSDANMATLIQAVSTLASTIDAEQVEINSVISELRANPDAAAVQAQVDRLVAFNARMADATASLQAATEDVSSTVTPTPAPSPESPVTPDVIG